MAVKPKVLLIYPGNKAWGFTYPVGLLYVAQSLRKIDVEVSILHLGVATLADLRYDDYLFVGINMMIGDVVGRGLEAAKLVKKFNPAIPIVLGGVYPSILPEQVLANPLIDIVVIGEGEETVKELASALKEKSDLANIKGLAYKADEKIVINAPRELINMETLGFDLPYELLGKVFAKSSVMPVHTSRGCPYRCGFCYSPMFNKRRYRYKSARRVVEEMEYLIAKYGIQNFNFDYEDEFFVNPDRAVEIFQTVLRRGLKIKWAAFCRFDSFCTAYARFGDDFVKLLKDSGCFYLSFGAESGSQKLLDEVVKKDIKIDQIYTTVDALKKHRIVHRITFITCLPGETAADLEDSFDVIDRISEDNRYLVVGIFNLIPLPQTSIMELLRKNYGFVPPSTMEDWIDYLPVKRERVTWHTKEYTSLCFAVSRMCPVPFYLEFDSYGSYKNYVKNSSGAAPGGYLAYLVTKAQRLRYKKRCFKHNFEMALFTKALGAYALVRNFLLDSILKKYLSASSFAALKKMFGKNDWAGGEDAR